VDKDHAPVLISALQHAVFCMRQAALIHIERQWAENQFTAEGMVLHEVAHDVGERAVRSVRRVMSLPLESRRLNLIGTADLIEFRKSGDAETAFPVEYKRGKPKLHRADEVQLCAQAICLEEMTGQPVPQGALFYAQTKRRQIVDFDIELCRLTETVALELGTLIRRGHTPPAIYRVERCRACSLIEICRPKAGARSAKAFTQRIVQGLLAENSRDVS
jgi:CRISPR-associated exonuclease Cas4